LGAVQTRRTVPSLGRHGAEARRRFILLNRLELAVMSDNMDRAERYREHAQECLAFAKSMADPTWRTQLVAMAAQWREFAERECDHARERNRQQAQDALSGKVT